MHLRPAEGHGQVLQRGVSRPRRHRQHRPPQAKAVVTSAKASDEPRYKLMAMSLRTEAVPPHQRKQTIRYVEEMGKEVFNNMPTDFR